MGPLLPLSALILSLQKSWEISLGHFVILLAENRTAPALGPPRFSLAKEERRQ